MNTRTILTCLLAGLWLLAGAAFAQAEDETPSAPVDEMEVVAVTGAVNDGGGGAVSAEATITTGVVVTTGADGRAAIAFGGAESERPDLLLVGPASEVAFVEAAGGGMAIELRRGLMRVFMRSGADTVAPTVSTGPRRVSLAGADALIEYAGEADDASYALRRGTLSIEAGERKLRLLPRMRRPVEGGRIMAASRLAGDEWNELVAATVIEGLDLTDAPVVAKPRTKAEAAPQVDPGAAPSASGDDDFVYARLSTTMGSMILQLDRGRAPVSVENFLAYANSGFYEGTIFHRVMSNFMIQGGGFDESWMKKPTMDPIENEWRNGLKNVRGTIAMARLGGQPDSATSQFFINVKDNPALDRPQPDGAAYAVFGRVIKGMEIVDAIKSIPVEPNPAMGGERSRPQEAPIIKGIVEIDETEALAD